MGADFSSRYFSLLLLFLTPAYNFITHFMCMYVHFCLLAARIKNTISPGQVKVTSHPSSFGFKVQHPTVEAVLVLLIRKVILKGPVQL